MIEETGRSQYRAERVTTPLQEVSNLTKEAMALDSVIAQLKGYSETPEFYPDAGQKAFDALSKPQQQDVVKTALQALTAERALLVAKIHGASGMLK